MRVSVAGRSLLHLILFFTASLLSGCAQVVVPPGGPIDDTGPFIISSNPANGSVNVSAGNQIRLIFSERVVRPAAGRAVYISPRPEEEPQLTWKGEQLIITLADQFYDDRTYVVTINNSVKDLRGNPIDSSVTIAFSTGPALDSGSIGGILVRDRKPQSSGQVALYMMEKIGISPIFDSLSPDYVVGVGINGRFAFRNLPAAAFMLIGFIDKNRDEFLNPDFESFALADRPIIVGDTLSLDNLYLSLTERDTTSVTILSAVETADHLMRIRLSRPVSYGLLSRQPSNAFLVSLTDSLFLYPATGVGESYLEESATLSLSFDAVPKGTYRFEITWSASDEPAVYDSIAISNADDSKPPVITHRTPDYQTVFPSESAIAFHFSEPIDTNGITDQTFVLWQDSIRPVTLSRHWNDPFSVRLDAGTLVAGSEYRLDLTEFDVMDLAGNALGDSLISYHITIYDKDSLGSISGQIRLSLSGKVDPVELRFKKIGNNRNFNLRLTSRTFTIDLPPGKYFLSGFVDSDLDGRYTPGTLFPLKYAETWAEYQDTIQVRARFETAGIELEFR